MSSCSVCNYYSDDSKATRITNTHITVNLRLTGNDALPLSSTITLCHVYGGYVWQYVTRRPRISVQLAERGGPYSVAEHSMPAAPHKTLKWPCKMSLKRAQPWHSSVDYWQVMAGWSVMEGRSIGSPLIVKDTIDGANDTWRGFVRVSICVQDQRLWLRLCFAWYCIWTHTLTQPETSTLH